ncbi:MAG: 5'-3' exonuclease [Chloroflexi bacterium]|nr:5'-3' exonuclease [Chloroflexota bacterium]
MAMQGTGGSQSAMIMDVMSEAVPLLVVDGDNLAHRAYHSIPKGVKGANGRPINAIVGWTNMLLYLWQTEQPRAVFVGWDTLGVPTYRHKLWPEYQAGRQFDDAIVKQLNWLPELCAAFGFGVGKGAGYEADDFLASAAREEEAQGGTSLVLTNDRDAYQIVTDATTVISPRKGIRELARIGPRQVVDYFGVLPEQVPDYKALAGDASDNIPGAKGVGPKAAAALLLKYGTLEHVLTAWASTGLRAGELDQLRAFCQIATVHADLPVTLPASGPPHFEAASALLRQWGANNLADRVEQHQRESLPR